MHSTSQKRPFTPLQEQHQAAWWLQLASPQSIFHLILEPPPPVYYSKWASSPTPSQRAHSLRRTSPPPPPPQCSPATLLLVPPTPVLAFFKGLFPWLLGELPMLQSPTTESLIGFTASSSFFLWTA